MKRILLILSLMASMLAANAQNSPNALMFEMKSGKLRAYFFDELPKLTFTAEDIVVTSHMYETSHPQSEVQRYTFTYLDPTDVNSPTLDGFHRSGNAVSITGIAAGSTVSVYSTDGKQLQSVNANANGAATISLEPLPTGVFLIKYDNSTVKIKRP